MPEEWSPEGDAGPERLFGKLEKMVDQGLASLTPGLGQPRPGYIYDELIQLAGVLEGIAKRQLELEAHTQGAIWREAASKTYDVAGLVLVAMSLTHGGNVRVDRIERHPAPQEPRGGDPAK